MKHGAKKGFLRWLIVGSVSILLLALFLYHLWRNSPIQRTNRAIEDVHTQRDAGYTFIMESMENDERTSCYREEGYFQNQAGKQRNWYCIISRDQLGAQTGTACWKALIDGEYQEGILNDGAHKDAGRTIYIRPKVTEEGLMEPEGLRELPLFQVCSADIAGVRVEHTAQNAQYIFDFSNTYLSEMKNEEVSSIEKKIAEYNLNDEDSPESVELLVDLAEKELAKTRSKTYLSKTVTAVLDREGDLVQIRSELAYFLQSAPETKRLDSETFIINDGKSWEPEKIIGDKEGGPPDTLA